MSINAEHRRAVTDRAFHCCEYCKSQLKYSSDSFSVEHIIPRSLGGTDDLSNLALSCQRCNNHNFTAIQSADPLSGRIVQLFHPREDYWFEHFAWSADYLYIRGLTPIGRATIEKLQLNREGVVNLRRILRAAGEHPAVG